jgi:hypothetical protein
MALTGCYTGKLRRIVEYDADHYMTVGDTLYRPKNLGFLPRIEERHFEWLDNPPPVDRLDYVQVTRLAMLRHENVHAVQQKGVARAWWFQLSYVLSRKARWKAEQEAYRIEMLTYHEYGYWKPWMRSQYVQFMMGEHYGKMTDEATAQAFVDKIAQEATNASR